MFNFIVGKPTAVSAFAMRSLRFNGADSAYLSRASGWGTATNNKIATFSAWLKRSALGAYTFVYGASDGVSAYGPGLYFTNTDALLVQFGGSAVNELVTNAVYRDATSWYHVVVAVDTTQATASNRVKLYVNGVQVTSFTTMNYPPQNAVLQFPSNNANTVIGKNFLSATYYFNGYIADFVFVDGQALTPSSFAQANAITGQWQPKQNPAAGLTLGTNGFWLSFDNNASTATLGFDDAGGNRGVGAGTNDWTLNSFSVAAGVNYDSTIDVPTSYDDGVNGRGNFCTLSPVNMSPSLGIYLSDGALRIYSPIANWVSAVATFGVSSGKWYWEASPIGANLGYHHIGICKEAFRPVDASYPGIDTNSWAYASVNGQMITNGGYTAYGATFGVGDVIGIALDMDNGKVYFAKNNTWQNSGDPVNSINPAVTGLVGPIFPTLGEYQADTCAINFGQQPFVYTPPTGFKALNAFNLPEPAIVTPAQYFDVATYTGSAGTVNVTGKAFQPNLLWIKDRSNAQSHKIVDSARGAAFGLSTDNTAVEVNDAKITFNADGFSVASGLRTYSDSNADAYVSWLWESGTIPGVFVAQATAPASGIWTVAHGLGATPDMFWFKTAQITTGSWYINHVSFADRLANYLVLNTTDPMGSLAGMWGQVPDATNVYAYVGYSTLASAVHQIVAFRGILGFSRFSSYVGNGSADGPFVWCGFRPKFLLFKDTTNIVGWVLVDATRDQRNVVQQNLLPNTSGIEGTFVTVDFTSNGFKLRASASGYNASGIIYVFAAFAENPFKYALAR